MQSLAVTLGAVLILAVSLEDVRGQQTQNADLLCAAQKPLKVVNEKG
jgi:hypothetical protein